MPWRSWLIPLFSALLITSSSQARWEKEEDAAAVIDLEREEIRINKDYSVETTEDFIASVKKEEGLRTLSMLADQYPASLSQFKVLIAETMIDGRILPIDLNYIEDKAIANQQGGYDDIRQVKIAFPGLKVGAKVHIKTWRKDFPALYSGFASFAKRFAERLPLLARTVRIESAVPIVHHLDDPEQYIDFSSSMIGTKTILSAKTRRTLYKIPAQEPLSTFQRPLGPVLYISTERGWGQLAAAIVPEYENRLKEALPIPFQTIYEKAAKLSDPIEKIESVLADLGKIIYYVGNWKTVRGKYFPRSLKEIADSKFGDCKDYSISFVAILRKLGIAAHPAWTNVPQSEIARITNFRPPLPVMEFNHAIARVVVNGQTYWLDPTSQIPVVRTSFPHLAGHYALPLAPQVLSLEIIPPAPLSDNRIEQRRLIMVNPNQTFDEIRRVRMTGFTAWLAHSAQKKQKALPKTVEQYLNNEEPEPGSSIEYTNDTGTSQMSLGSDTTAGAGIPFEQDKLLFPFLIDHTQTAGDLSFSFFPGFHRKTQVVNAKLIGTLPSACKVTSPWYITERKFEHEGDFLFVTESLEIKTPTISNSELQGEEFKKARDSLQKCWKNNTLIVDYHPPFEPFPVYRFGEPWKVPRWKFKLEKMKRSAKSLWGRIRRSVTHSSDEPQASFPGIAPEWSASRSSEALAEKAEEFRVNYAGDGLTLLLSKALYLEAFFKSASNAKALAGLAMTSLDLTSDFKQGKREQAVFDSFRPMFSHAVEMDPFDATANAALIKWLIESRNLDDAHKQGLFSLSLNPHSHLAQRQMAAVYYNRNEMEKAEEYAKKTNFYRILHWIYEKQKRFDDDNNLYLEQLRLQPTAWAHGNYAAFLMNRDQVDEAINEAKAALKIMDYGMAHHILSMIYSKKALQTIRKDASKIQEALGLVKLSLDEDPAYDYAHQLSGYFYQELALKELNQETRQQLMRQAGQHYLTALRINPKNESAQRGLNQLKELYSRLSLTFPFSQ